jgi:uncharacterized membrane protein
MAIPATEPEIHPPFGSRFAKFPSSLFTWLARLVNQPSRFVFVTILFAGLAIALLTPPLKGADERDHFTRAYQLAGGDFSVHKGGARYGAILPSGYEKDISQLSNTVYLNHDHAAFLRLLRQAPITGKRSFTQEGTVASYGPGAYVAFVPVIAIGRALGLSLAMLDYLARIAGVLAYACLMSLAVRRAPTHRWIFVAAALIPEALNQASTVSADGITMALTAVVIANALRLSVDEDIVSRRLVVESLLAALVLALAKPPYVAFVLLFAIPAWTRRRRLFAPLSALIVGSFAVSALWVGYQRTHSVSLDLPGLTLFSGRHFEYAYRNIDITKQTHFVLTQPWRLPTVIWHTVEYQGLSLPKEMVGLLAQYQIPPLVVLLAVVVLAASCFVPDETPTFRLHATDRLGLLALTAAVGLAICAIVYITANALHAPRIDQLTPRYFLPLVTALLIGLLPNVHDSRISHGAAAKHFVQFGIVVVLVFTIVGLTHSYYGPSHLV